MPTTYHRRPGPCTHCGDAVVVVETHLGRLLGVLMRESPTIRLEHADPSPEGDVFDPVDDGCRRARVVR